MSEEVKRNFENYATKREAFLAYEGFCYNCKTPIWIRGDEAYFPCAVVVDFNDWIWLPVNESQQYKESEYDVQQYLGRRFI